MIRFSVGLAFLLGALWGAGKKPVTLDSLQSMRMPDFAGLPEWSPGGKTFVFSRSQKLILYEIASKKETELISLEDLRKDAVPPPRTRAMAWQNRRVRERQVQWASSGKAILLSVSNDLFLWTEGSGVTQLTKTAALEQDAKLSPDASKVSYRIDSDLYVLDVASKKSLRLTHDGSATLLNGMLDWVYPEELDLGTAHWWSPDSKSVAYLQFDISREQIYPHMDHLPVEAVSEPQRYPKAGSPNADVRVGVVSAAGGSTRWLDFGETRDYLIARIAWSPNSREVTAHRLNRIQNKLEILACDVESNTRRTLVVESDPAWINLTDDFRYLSNGDFVLTSERDGFRHLYRYGNGGRTVSQITKGAWEISQVACVDEAGKKVYYVSTEKSPLERHLYVIGMNGRDQRQITREEGSHSVSMNPDCTVFADSHSNLSSPSRRTLRNASDGAEIAVLSEANRSDADEYEILKTEFHTFQRDDGTQFHARLIRPAGFDPQKKYPAIVMVYGGPHAQSVRNAYAGLSWDQVLAHQGFVIWQMDNRGSSGRGHAWEAKLHRRLGQVELEDQVFGVRHLVSMGFVDPQRVGIYGWSYGGFMTIYALLHAPEVFAAGVAGAAVTDWRNYDTIYTERYLGLPQDNEEGYRLSSPVHAASNLKGKLLLLHNIGDDNVLFANALQMTNALQLAGKPFDTQIYPQKSHGVTGKASRHMRETATRFFVEHLKP